MVHIVPTLLLSISALLAFTEAKADPGACFLTVPKDPLTPHGLATPYILKKGNCDQTNPAQQVFVEATIFDPSTKTFGVYHPLVINEGTSLISNIPTSYTVAPRDKEGKKRRWSLTNLMIIQGWTKKQFKLTQTLLHAIP